MFSDLLHVKNLSNTQVKKAISLSKKFSPTNKSDLEKANGLLFSLFFAENHEGVNICLDILTKLKFNGNFNLWSFIEPSYCLKYLLTDDDTIKAEITRMLREDVKSKWDDDDEHKEFIQRIVDGELVQSAQDELNIYIDDGVKSEYIWRENLLIKYLHVLSLGATGKLSKNELVNEINSNILKLRELYRKIEI